MAFSKSFIFALLVVVTMTSMNIEARHLLQTTTLPHTTIPTLPKPSFPDLDVIPSLPKGSLPPLHTSITSLPKHIIPFPFPSTDPTIDVTPVSAPTPATVSDTPKSLPSFFSFFPFFSKTPSTSNP
ncbi:unnamed protein product [Vicia faba]|uniref:Uncharacterized protein n=1 Tax=Vicia faba TaxID=3906 RepID=A0AAV1B956_VICFA|nr:unnamed protein product [Vicia faba]